MTSSPMAAPQPLISPKLFAIAAMAPNRVIGVDGAMPWRIPEELRWFREATMGHAVLMGRKTFESIGRPLPGRLNLVASRREKLRLPAGVERIRDLASFDPTAVANEKVFVAGGAEVYRELLSHCVELWLTRIRRKVAGDAVMPPFEANFEERETLREEAEFSVVRFVNKRAPEAAL